MSNPIVGSTVRIQITVTDPDTGDKTNGTVDLTIRDPSGNETTPTPDNPDTGIYQHYLDLDEAGYFDVVWNVQVGEFVTVEACSVCALASVLAGSP